MLGSAPERGVAAKPLIDACRNLESIADVMAVVDDLALEVGPDCPPRLTLKLERGGKPAWVPVREIQADQHPSAGLDRGSEVIEQPGLSSATRPVIDRPKWFGPLVTDARPDAVLARRRLIPGAPVNRDIAVKESPHTYEVNNPRLARAVCTQPLPPHPLHARSGHLDALRAFRSMLAATSD
jgi:hypothetical protein